MNSLYASRMDTIPKSFVREILKTTQEPEIISFAGGLPNPRFFPVWEIAEAAAEALTKTDGSALQYGTTEGYAPLREYIADRYQREGLNVTADEILITNGSQQGLDLLGKAFLDRQDAIAIERPGYLGAIQAFSAYEPEFHPVPLLDDGIDLDQLAEVLRTRRIKFFYTVINFQNPSGISYSEGKRATLADVLTGCDTLVVKDAMLAAIETYFSAEVHVTRPEGGMFLWATLPSQLSAMELFEHAAREKVVFVPGTPFFVDGGGTHNMRLNFSNADEDKIEEGIARLGRIITNLLTRKGGSQRRR